METLLIALGAFVALLWVLFGSIFIGAMHDLGSLAVEVWMIVEAVRVWPHIKGVRESAG